MPTAIADASDAERLHIPAEAPELHPGRPPPGRDRQGDDDVEDLLN